ncbi:MAG: polysaccharide biosynthesis C-terminal domain-containing protein [Deltaproteobacteria bacterium]|nr:polysaccharide biosynthesis C-terminal domain-containing protein [Deltaproteobacteria bacterium]
MTAPSSDPPDPDAPAPAAKPAGASAGRGVLYIAFAKFYFMIGGLLIQIRLPSLLSRVVFGAYGFVSSVVSPFNNVMVTGSIQAVSRFTAQKPETARAVERAGLRMHLYVGLPVALLFIAGAPLVSWAIKDPTKTVPLMVSGVIIGGYSFYAVLIGTANGQREFHKQAGLDIAFTTLRVTGILGMAMAGLGLVGVVAGWVAAVGAILMIATVWVGLPGRTAEKVPVGPMLRYFLGVAVYLALFNVLMFVDTWLVKRLTSDWYAAHADHFAGAIDRALPWAREVTGFHYDPAQLADVQVAYYTAVQTLARLSYQAIIAATFVVFPLVSKSTLEGDQDTTRRYVHVTMRYSLMFSTAIAVVMAANPEWLLRLPFPADYAALGAPALSALALGNVAFSIFAIAGTILNGAGYTKDAIITAAVTLVVAIIGNLIVIPQLHPGADVLLGAALVTGSAMFIGACLVGWRLHVRLGAFIPLLSVVRVGVAILAGIAVGWVVPFQTPLMTLVEAALVGVVFLAVLIATGELGRKDLAAIKSVRAKRGQGDAA